MPVTVEPRIRTVAGVDSTGATKILTNGNASDYWNVRLTDGSAFYIASGSSGGGGTATTVNVGSYGGTATTLGQKAKSASIPVTIASDNTVNTFFTNTSDIVFTPTGTQDINIIQVAGKAVLEVGNNVDDVTSVTEGLLNVLNYNYAWDGSRWQRVYSTTSAPGSGDKGLIVRNIPNGTQNVGIVADSLGLASNATVQSVVDVLTNVTSTSGGAVPPKLVYVGFRDLSANLNFARVFGNNTNIGTQSGNVIGVSAFPYIKNGSTWEPITGIGSNGMTVTGSNLTITSMPTTNVSVTGQPISTNASQNGAWFTTSSVSNTVTVTGSNITIAQAPTTTVTGSNITIAQAPTTTVTQSVATNFKAQIDNSSWGGTATTLGNKSMAASVPVTMASDQTNFGVNASQSGAWFTTSNVSNTVTVTGSNISIAQAPTTTVTQTIASNFKTQVDNASWGGTATTLGNKSMAASVPVTIASDQTAYTVNASQSGTWGVNINRSPRPTSSVHSSVDVTSASTTLFNVNSARLYLEFYNNGSTTAYMNNSSAASSSTGFPIVRSLYYANSIWSGAVSAVTVGNTSANFRVIEYA